MPKRREKKDEGLEMESSGGMRWLLTYADMITLLLAFFIVMYATSASDASKYKKIHIEIAKRFGVLSGSDALMGGVGGTAQQRYTFLAGSGDQQLEAIQVRLEEAIAEKGLTNKVTMGKSERGLVITLLTDKVLFRVGEAGLLPAVEGILHELAVILKQTDNQVVIEGHTCDLAISSGRYPSNWELSTSRAVNVLKYFVVREKLSPARLSAAGYGSHRPLVPNEDETRRKLNRRVDIIIIKSE